MILGPNITPAAMAALDPVAEYETPMITLIGSAFVVEPQEGKKCRRSKWPRPTARWPT